MNCSQLLLKSICSLPFGNIEPKVVKNHQITYMWLLVAGVTPSCVLEVVPGMQVVEIMPWEAIHAEVPNTHLGCPLPG